VAAKERIYWIGKGVVSIGGKKYGKGEEIPADQVDKKTLEAWEKADLISNIPVALRADASEAKNLDRIRELEIEVSKAKTLRTVNKDLKKKLTKAEKDNEDLEKENKTLTTDNQEKEALIEKLNGDVKDLEEKLKASNKSGGE
jgi:hypothetical protein